MTRAWKHLAGPVMLPIPALVYAASRLLTGTKIEAGYLLVFLVAGMVLCAVLSNGLGLIGLRKKKKVDEARILARMRDARPGLIRTAISAGDTGSHEL